MNPNDFEEQQRLAIQRRVKLEARNRKKLQKERDETERKQKRLKPFEALAADNRKIGERAQKMIDLRKELGGNYPHTESPWIVLRRGDDLEFSWTLGVIKKRNARKLSLQELYDFKVYTTDAESAARAIKKPIDTKIKAPDPLVETTFYTHLGGIEEDDIMQFSSVITSTRKFSPIQALRRRNRGKSTQERLSDLEETAAMFEEAISNSELNPHLKDVKKLLLESGDHKLELTEGSELTDDQLGNSAL